MDKAFDMSSRHGSSLFTKGCEQLPFSFTLDTQTGKKEDIFRFQQALGERATRCAWDNGAHDILSVPKMGTAPLETYSVLKDFAQLSTADLQAAKATRTDNRAKQNSEMMHMCILNSLSTLLWQTILTSEVELDGPILFHTLMNMTAVATFPSLQAARNSLQSMHPTDYAYCIIAVNNAIRRHILTLHQGNPKGQPVA
jgi:hypothetical protein